MGEKSYEDRDQQYDIIYLYSVFSHMVKEDVKVYLKEFQRLLTLAGKTFLTGFVEEGVPEMTVNPLNYRGHWKGSLHCVRYDKAFIEALLDEHGFVIDQFDYEAETDGRSGLYVSRKKKEFV